MGALETQLGVREKCEYCSWSAENGGSAENVVWAASDPRSRGLCGDSSLEQGHPVRKSHRGSVLGAGQEKSLNSSHLCQKLQCLSSQSQEASAPGGCTGGLLVLPTLWGSQGWHKDSCRCCSGTGAVALWSHFKGVIMEHFGGCFWNSICSWISLRVQQSRCCTHLCRQALSSHCRNLSGLGG
nr:uncharacterized protein LOC121469813 isoform X2 [Taeniopygia guttata]XP_041571407.1 uncharacterized protein LOC121469813 isoform X3 [Taeniopygia guttata]